MRKTLVVTILLFFLSGVAGAQVQVFFLPDSGFLRVHGEVIIEPSSPSLSFLIFPTAQITELWADELMEYNIKRGTHGTVVSLSLKQARPQTLSFSYEGFVHQQGIQVSLDRDSLWFPEFSFPSESPNVNLELPQHWEIVGQPDRSSSYPTFVVRNTQDRESERTLPVAETPVVETPVVNELTSRIRMQVTRLTNSINQRNQSEIEALLSPSLREAGLARYLASFPASYGTLVINNVTDDFSVAFTTDRGLNYEASMLWVDREGRVELVEFQLTPAGLQIPEELSNSVQNLVTELQLAVQTNNKETLDILVDENIAQGKDHILEFLLSLNGTAPWSLEYAALAPFTITVFIPHGPETKILLHLGLTPGRDNWLIHRLEILPVG